MTTDTDASTVDAESIGSKRNVKRASGAPYKKRGGSAPARRATTARDDSEKKREAWLKALRTGNGKTLSGRPITGTTGAATSRSVPGGPEPRSIKVTMKTDSSDRAFLSSSKFLQQKMLANSIMAATNGEFTSTPRTVKDQPNSGRQFAPSSRQPEDMVDEIMDLKRKLAGMEGQMNLQKGRLRRLEEENNRKDKQIEQLLNPSASDDTRRTLGGDSTAVINSLKNKIMRLEMTLKEKENELRRVQDDVKTTRTEEMKICMEAFYQEIMRLRAAVHTGKKTSLGTEGKGEKADESLSARKVRTLNANLTRLSEANKQLEQENASLKADLETAIANQSRPSGTEFEDMDRDQLLASIAELQKKVDKYERVMADQVADYEPEVDGKLKLEGSFADRYNKLDARETELLKELDKLKVSLSKSREERDSWRSSYEQLKLTKRQSSDEVPEPKLSVAPGGYRVDAAPVGLDEPDGVSRVSQRRQEDEQWRQRARESTAKRPGSSVARQGDTRNEQLGDSKVDEAAVQLQSLLRAHMARGGVKPPSTHRASVAGSVFSGAVRRPSADRAGGGGPSAERSGAMSRAGRLTPDDDGESTARTFTERSQRTNLEPISDKSETSSMDLGRTLRQPLPSPKKKQAPAAPSMMDMMGGGGGGGAGKPRRTEPESSEAEDTTTAGGGDSETDTSPTPRAKPRKSAVPAPDYGF